MFAPEKLVRNGRVLLAVLLIFCLLLLLTSIVFSQNQADDGLVAGFLPITPQLSHDSFDSNKGLNTPTVTPTATPGDPYIRVMPNCGIEPQVQFHVLGSNWPNNEAIAMYWDSVPHSIIPQGHGGSFSQTWVKDVVGSDPDNPYLYEVRAQSASHIFTTNFSVPCRSIDPSPSPTPSPTVSGTPPLPDIAILGTPAIISIPPLDAYQPIDVALVVRNIGTVDVNELFFVDLYFDPDVVLTDSIPISQSVGYMAINSLAAGETRVVMVTAPLGFRNEPEVHTVYGWADSIDQIPEPNESNNISPPALVFNVTPAVSPTPSPTPGVHKAVLRGIVRNRQHEWQRQYRATVTIIDERTSQQVGVTYSGPDGSYQFTGLPKDNLYTVKACVQIDGETYSGARMGLVTPTDYADLWLLPGPCP